MNALPHRVFRDVENFVRGTSAGNRAEPGIKKPNEAPRYSKDGNTSGLPPSSRDDVRDTIPAATGGTQPARAGGSSRLLTPALVDSDLPDIDSKDTHNHLACAEYAVEIYNFYHRIESRYLSSDKYMEQQTEITPWMRGVLIDWLVEVHLKFKLMPETLFLTVNLIDRFLSKRRVRRKELQLAGVAAMFLASKYEEIWAPEVRDFVYICDKAYNRRQIIDMEKQIIFALNFNMAFPTSHHFMARYAKAAAQTDKEFSLLCSFLVELTLTDYSMLQHVYSKISAAAVMLALQILHRPGDSWPEACESHSGYTQEELEPIVERLKKLVVNASDPESELRAVYKKYSSSKFGDTANRWRAAPELFPISR